METSGLDHGHRTLRVLRNQAQRIPGRKRVLRVLLGLLTRLASTPVIGPRAERLITAITETLEQPMPVAEVLRILAAVRAQSVQCWLGGGWGVDALLGFPSRDHSDLDLVLDDFDGELASVTDALATTGYRCVSTDRAGVWLPHRASFQNGRGHSIEVLGIDWEVLDAAWSLLAPARGVVDGAAERKARCFANGELAGHSVPCLSRGAQLLFHSGYAPSETDLRDVRHLEALSADRAADRDVALFVGETALLVPILGADPRALQVWTEFNGGQGLPPHITVLFPFLPGEQITGAVLDRLAAVCAQHRPFDFSLERTGWFDDRVLFLQPTASEAFVELVRDIMREFPDCKPYGGAFADIHPHLTIGEDQPRARLRRAEVRVRRQLPIKATAAQLWLLAGHADGEGWSVVHSITLGEGRAREN
jgi:2'-5' RNA ligase superfamily/Aminoglycoside-2''-adenylyltransferase